MKRRQISHYRKIHVFDMCKCLGASITACFVEIVVTKVNRLGLSLDMYAYKDEEV